MPALTSERVSLDGGSTVRAHAWAIAVWVAMAGLVGRALRSRCAISSWTSDSRATTSGTWCRPSGALPRPPARGHGRRHGRADDAPRAARRSDPRCADALLDRRAPSPLTLVAVQIVAVALGALPVLLARAQAPRLGADRRACSRSPTSPTRGWPGWRSTAFHPADARDPAPSLLHLVPRLGSPPSVRSLCRGGCMTCGELVGVWIAALGLWYALRAGTPRSGLVIARRARLDSHRRSSSSCLRSPASRATYFSVYDAVGGSPSGVVRTAFTRSRGDPLGGHARRGLLLRGDAGDSARRPVPPGACAGGRGASAARGDTARGLSCDDRSARALHRRHRSVPLRRHRARPRAALPSRATTRRRARTDAVRGVRRRPRPVARHTRALDHVVLGRCAGRARERASTARSRSCPRARRSARRTGSARISPSGGTSTACPSWVARSGSSSIRTTRGSPGGSAASRIPRRSARSSRRIAQDPAWEKVFDEDGVLVFRRVGA